MLYLDFNIPEENVMQDPSGVFDAYYEIDWFNDPEIVRIAEEIDKVKHDFSDAFVHEVFGRFSGNKLSGGVKIVVLAYLGITLNKALPLDWLGENCFRVLGSLDMKHDIVFCANSMPHLMDFECEFISKHSGAVIRTHEQYMEEFLEYADKSFYT